MDEENLSYLLNFAKEMLEKAEEKSNPNSIIDYRFSAQAIVNFYNVILLNAGKELDLNIKQGHNLDWKFFKVSIEIQELFEFESLIKKVKNIRDHVSHSDVKEPHKGKLKSAINSAEEFKDFVETSVGTKIKTGKKQKSLKEQYAEKIDFIRRLLKSTLPDFKDAAIESSEFRKVFKRLNDLERINVGGLNNSSLKSLLEIVDDTIDDAEHIYEYLHSHCPDCGGKLKIRTEEKSLYRSHEDYEPYGFNVYQVIECSNCSKEIDREIITTEYI